MQKDLTSQINHLIGLYAKGNPKAAMLEVQRLIRTYPGVPFLFNVEAACHIDLGQPQAAVTSYQQALTIKPDYYEVQYNLGNLLRKLGKFEAAVACFEQALKIKNDFYEAHIRLGFTHLKLAQWDRAVSSFEHAIKIRNDDPVAHNNLGTALGELGKLPAATASFERAVELRPDYVEALNNLAFTLGNFGQLDAAIENFQRVLALRPDDVQAYHSLASACQRGGRLAEAVEALEKALQLKPDHADALYALSGLKKFTQGDEQIAYMERLLLNGEINESDRMHLCFALAKAYDDTGDYDHGFERLAEANGLRKKQLHYDRERTEQFFSMIKDTFSVESDAMDLNVSDEHSALEPVFIVGMPRSGTTLVEQILASHSKVFGAGELDAMRRLTGPILSKYPSAAEVQFDNQSFRKDIESLRVAYLDVLSALKVDERIVTDKMPGNFIWIGYILAAFPAARIINIDRNPVAVCWSNFRQNFFADGLGFAYDLEDAAHFYHRYVDLMSFWRKRYPNRIYDICYEELTENQEQETRKLLTYCDLDWEQGCLNFHRTKREVKTASVAQVREKMYTGSSEVWRKYEHHLQPLIRALNQLN